MAAELRIIDGSNVPEMVDSETGERLTLNGEFIANRSAEAMKDMMTEFFSSELGEQFETQYGTDTVNPHCGKTNGAIIDAIFNKLFPDGIVTLSRFHETVKTANEAGELARLPEPVAQKSRREDNGRFADEHALLRQEVRRMLADPNVPASAIRDRKRRDAAFARAVDAEMSPPKAPIVKPSADPDLVHFAESYRLARSLRPIAGYVTLDGRKWPVSEFNAAVNEAIEAGLL